MKNRKLKALIIWWCEGTKARRDYRWKNAYLYPIEVINTNPKIIKIFLDFLKEDMKVVSEKVKGQLQIHEGDNKTEIEKYWSEYLNLPIKQFNKTIIRKRGNKVGKTRGTFKLRVYNKKLFNKLQTMLDKEIS